jgi:2-oxoisovalerate ferredoxin oxidoreductase beta subunit
MQPAYSCPATFYKRFERKDGNQETTHYCPGCGHGHIHKYIAEALVDFGVADRAVLISPVGCSVFAYYYIDAGNVQVAHGRSPAVATGIKRAHPDAIVIGYQGDGDLAAIGGNEIVQAANRGENYTVFFINNAIYGMTGGQLAPTTLMDMKTSTTPAGRSAANEGFPIKVCELLNALTAPYYLERVAIGTPAHNRKARAAVRKALRNQIDNKGFSLVEVLSPCPTGWKMKPVDAAKWTVETMPKVFPLGVYRDGHDLDLGHPRRRKQVALGDLPRVLGTEVPDVCTLAECGTPIREARFKISGLGGQGVLLLGQILAQAGMLAQRQVTWMPSYGPEMRGGTASCNVIVAPEEIGSPLITEPTVLVAMNGPSVERFGKDVVPGGTLLYNASMVPERPNFPGIRIVGVAANEIADSLGDLRVQNMVMLGAVLACDATVSKDAIWAALAQLVKSKPELLELNKRAIEAGIAAVAAAGR